MHLQFTWVGAARAHINVTIFTQFAQNCKPACIVWLYYVCSYTVALSPGIISSFAVLHTEKLAFQCVTLLSREEGLQGDKAMNLAVRYGTWFLDNFFFCLVCWFLEKKKGWISLKSHEFIKTALGHTACRVLAKCGHASSPHQLKWGQLLILPVCHTRDLDCCCLYTTEYHDWSSLSMHGGHMLN